MLSFPRMCALCSVSEDVSQLSVGMHPSLQHQSSDSLTFLMV